MHVRIKKLMTPILQLVMAETFIIKTGTKNTRVRFLLRLRTFQQQSDVNGYYIPFPTWLELHLCIVCTVWVSRERERKRERDSFLLRDKETTALSSDYSHDLEQTEAPRLSCCYENHLSISHVLRNTLLVQSLIT